MNNNGDLNLRNINVDIDPAKIIDAINMPFTLMIQESSRFLERRHREYMIEKRKEDIIPGFLRRDKTTLKPIKKAFRDTKKFVNFYVPVIDDNMRKIGAIQRGFNEVARGSEGKLPAVYEEVIEKIIDKKIDERLKGVLTVLANGNKDFVS